MKTLKANNELTVPYEGDPSEAENKYSLKITKQKRFIDGSFITTFTGTRENLLKLLDEFGGEENVLDVMDEPYGRIKENLF